MFLRANCGQALPRWLSSDHDPLYRLHPWQANLRVPEVAEIKNRSGRAMLASVYRTVDWIRAARVPGPDSVLDPARWEAKLFDFQPYFHSHRTPSGLEGRPPEPEVGGITSPMDLAS
jgi:hypothetical protein